VSRLRILGETLGRSFFPLASLVVIGSAVVWSPWVSLVLAFAIYTLIKLFA
jgi:hypothetical protein